MGFLKGFFSIFGNYVVLLAILSNHIPNWYAMPPPQLTAYAPILNICQPVIVYLQVATWKNISQVCSENNQKPKPCNEFAKLTGEKDRPAQQILSHKQSFAYLLKSLRYDGKFFFLNSKKSLLS